MCWFWHDWKWLRNYGYTFQIFKCTKCGKEKIIDK